MKIRRGSPFIFHFNRLLQRCDSIDEIKKSQSIERQISIIHKCRRLIINWFIRFDLLFSSSYRSIQFQYVMHIFRFVWTCCARLLYARAFASIQNIYEIQWRQFRLENASNKNLSRFDPNEPDYYI